MEEEIKVKTSDGKTIYGTLQKSKTSNELIIFVHGLTGHRHEHIFYNGARFFEEEGYDTFRFDLYGFEEDARKLKECTIKIHGEDITKILEFFKKNYRKIHLVGHSLGGPSILSANTKDVSSIVLWDPSYNLNDLKEMIITQENGMHTVNWGVSYIIGKEWSMNW